MKAFSLIFLFSFSISLKVNAYNVANIEGHTSDNELSLDVQQAKIFEIDDDGMGPLIPKEIEQNRFPASIPADDENGHTHDGDGKYKRPYK